MEEEKIRLYVGGLASEVSAGDLQERFAPLGNVQSITLPSAKTGPGHRGFAYVDFVPATDASLRKLFSAYNGCKWRGGLLRIEKAKEHFSDRLHREWAIEAASSTTDPPPNEVEVVQQSTLASALQKQINGGNKADMEAGGLSIFFPKLRKLKTVPLTGLGKHKRSFQRVESSPLQLLLTCACEESLCSGSCDCSNMNDGIPYSKEDMCRVNDDIAQAIEIERQTQLELLNRLFPSDSTSVRLDNQPVVELDDSEEKGISEHVGMVGSVEKTSSEQNLPTTITERVKIKRPKHSQQRSEGESAVAKRDSDYLDPGNGAVGFDDDSTSTAVARERAKQLELMHRLFPADAPSIREAETVVQPENNKAKKRRKLDALGNSADLFEPVMDGGRATKTEHSVQLQNPLTKTNSGQQSSERQKLSMEHEQEMKMLKSIPPLKSHDSLENASKIILNPEDDSVRDAIAEDQESHALKSTALVTTDALTEDDSEMVLNVGDASLSLSIAEEQEKHELKSLSARTNELLERVSEMTRYLTDNSLSRANAEVRQRQMSKNSQDVMLEDGLEESEMTLNLGNDSLPLSKAEEQEKALVRSFSFAKHYDWTTTHESSDSEEADEIEESGSEEVSSDDSSDAEEGDQAEDNETEDHSSGKQGESDSSSGAEAADEAVDSDTEEHSSQEQDDSLYNNEYSELIPPNQRAKSKVAEASLHRLEGESSVGKQPYESSKWAALADMCQFRTESTMQSEESKLEQNSVLVARSNKEQDTPSIQVPVFQGNESNIPSQQQTDAYNNEEKPDDPSSSGQKLTRAAWKSLVGETGRVVFSLLQLTGSRLPQPSPLPQETQTIEDTHTQVDPSMSSKTLNQKEAKSKPAASSSERKYVGVRSSIEPKLKASEPTNAPVNLLHSPSDVCPFMKSENAELEWLATKSDLRSDYRAKHKYAARNVKKLRGRR